MIELTPRYLFNYSVCPKLCKFQWYQEPNVSTLYQILNHAIKYIYIYQERFEQIPTWRHITSAITQYITKYVTDPLYEDDQLRYKKSIGHIAMMHNWYHEYYLKQYVAPAFVNFPVIVGLGHHMRLYDTIDIVLIDDIIRIFDIYDTTTSKTDHERRQVFWLRNDMIVHIKAWLFWQASGVMPHQYTRILLKQTKIKPISIKIKHSMLIYIEKVIKQLTTGIRDNIYYPSITSQCQVCLFANECKLFD